MSDAVFLILIAAGLWLPLMAIGWWLTAMVRALLARDRRSLAAGGRIASESLLWILWSFVGFPAIVLALLWFITAGR